MRLTYVSASALLVLVNACSGGDDGSAQTDTTSDTNATQSTNTSSTNDDTDEQQSVAPDDDTTDTSPPATNDTSGASPSSSAADTTSTLPSQSDDMDSDASESDTSSEASDDPTDNNSDTTEADTSSDPTDESDETNVSDESDDPVDDSDVIDTGADDKFSFFVTSYHHLVELSGSEDGFGGDLRYDGAATGLEGADAICQEIARRVGFGNKTWHAYLSTSTVNAIDRIGSGPWYDFLGVLVAMSPSDLIAGGNRQPGGCCETGTYDELGLFHDGTTDQNNDGVDDDDHDTMTATGEDGTYAGFSCEDWTSTTATSSEEGGEDEGGGQFGGGGGQFGGGGGIMMGHTWPARSGEHWATSHGGPQCAAGTNFVQNGGGASPTVGGGGGYGGFYCFAIAE